MTENAMQKTGTQQKHDLEERTSPPRPAFTRR